MFIDRVRIRVTAGRGGDGCTSFRREKFVPRGGPDGGDGGDGGNIYLVADGRLSTLLDLKYHTHWVGARGQHGKGKKQHGRTGQDTLVAVPAGTLVFSFPSNSALADLDRDGERFLAARGGKGGRGNARFATSTNRVPRFAEKGEAGAERELLLELRLIADIGIVGLPNAGKSTLLAAISAAQPKIGDYPFTTVSPNLGVVKLDGYRSMTVADIPGLIEGAATGKGLGHDFLRHLERTKALLFLIDPSAGDPEATLGILEAELAEYSSIFASKPRRVAWSKADLPANRETFECASAEGSEQRLVSGLTGEGITELLETLWELQENAPEVELYRQESEPVYAFEPPFEVERGGGGFVVTGRNVERAVHMTDFENEEALRHLQLQLGKMGLFKALRRLGAENGQPIYIDDVELEYRER